MKFKAWTERQIRTWLHTKLKNYLWKIHGRNAYGSRKQIDTILRDLRFILNRCEGEWQLATKVKQR